MTLSLPFMLSLRHFHLRLMRWCDNCKGELTTRVVISTSGSFGFAQAKFGVERSRCYALERFLAEFTLNDDGDFSLRYPATSPAGFDAFAGQTA